MIDGRMMYPRMHGDKGWYDFAPEKYSHGALQVYYWSMDRADLERLPKGGWIGFLEGREPELSRARLCGRTWNRSAATCRRIREDATTPDTRLADDPLMVSPAAVATLVQLDDRWALSRPQRFALAQLGCGTSIRRGDARACPRTWRRWSRSSRPTRSP